MLNLEILRIIAALIFTGAAAWQDYKTSYISEKVLFPMIAFGLIFNVISGDQNLMIAGIGGALIILAIGFVFYKTGQLGMGDVLLFAGLQLLLPQFTSLALNPSIFPPVLSVIWASSLLALVLTSVYYICKLFSMQKIHALELGGILLGFTAISIILMQFLPIANAVLFSTFIALMIAMLFLKQKILDFIIIQKVPLKGIEDEDVIATEKIPSKILQKYGIGRVATMDEVKKLKSLISKGILSKIPVYKNLPRFAPYILMGLILTIFLGDLTLYLLP